VKLLISVSNAAEASDALAGGADIIDAKDPRRGALGAVTLDVLRDIVDVVGTSQPVSAAWATPMTRRRSASRRELTPRRARGT
jgi:uncharacterized protein (UPF0264 family)